MTIPIISGFWTAGKSPSPVLVTESHFQHKSLSNWAVNIAVGCSHACRFCYVPSASTNKLAPHLRELGVRDPDTNWGDYVFLRTWDERQFRRSLAIAQQTPTCRLKADGNRAVMFCSTTDPYQLYPHPVLEERKRLEDHGRFIMRRALELIRDHSALNVRILTRSPLAREDFDLFKTYGHRLLFGMSVPTLRNDLAKVYEPKAPAPSVRLQTLKQAKDAGIPIFIAMAPTYPECTEEDLHTTLREIAKLNPTTVFHEPINIRAENVERISTHARNVGVHVDSSVFASMETWRAYAIGSLQSVERIAKEEGLTDRQLHLWPDKRLGSAAAVARLNHTERAFRLHWLHSHWDKVSAWPQAIDREPGAPSGDQPFATKCTHRNSVVDLATSRSPDDTYIPV